MNLNIKEIVLTLQTWINRKHFHRYKTEFIVDKLIYGSRGGIPS